MDLLGRGFEAEGFCVVRGPDILWGGDIREFNPPAGVFAGIIGGPPCQDFSSARRSEPTGYGVEMLAEYVRVVMAAAPEWFLMENVPGCPAVDVPGFTVQRFFLNAAECGGTQHRNRRFQFGSRDATSLIPGRRGTPAVTEAACMAIEGTQRERRTWEKFCELQGLPAGFDLPGWSLAAKYRAVGNGVPVYMAAVISRAVKERHLSRNVTLCRCGCGRAVTGRQLSATPACRKRLERARRAA